MYSGKYPSLTLVIHRRYIFRNLFYRHKLVKIISGTPPASDFWSVYSPIWLEFIEDGPVLFHCDDMNRAGTCVLLSDCCYKQNVF